MARGNPKGQTIRYCFFSHSCCLSLDCDALLSQKLWYEDARDILNWRWIGARKMGPGR